MGTIELLFLGLGLSMDAAAVSISNTLAYPHLTWPTKLRMPLLFGLFQGLMPALGYLASGLFAGFIDAYAGSVTFFILCFIGGKMIIDIFYPKDGPISVPRFTWLQGCLQAVATSLDAFAVGISLRACSVPLGTACPIIAFVTFICCTISLFLGERFASFLGNKAAVLGGLLLIALGLKALF